MHETTLLSVKVVTTMKVGDSWSQRVSNLLTIAGSALSHNCYQFPQWIAAANKQKLELMGSLAGRSPPAHHWR